MAIQGKVYVDNKRAATADELAQVAQWFRAAIPTLRKANKEASGFDSLGVHVRYGIGLGKHFSQAFSELSINKVIRQLADSKVACSVMARGGPIFYLWSDKPTSYKAEPVDSDVIAEAIRKNLALVIIDDVARMNRESQEPTTPEPTTTAEPTPEPTTDGQE